MNNEKINDGFSCIRCNAKLDNKDTNYYFNNDLNKLLCSKCFDSLAVKLKTIDKYVKNQQR